LGVAGTGGLKDNDNFMNDLVFSIRENYLKTLRQIADAAQKSKRNPHDVRLVVVTKSQPLQVAQPVCKFSVRIIPKRLSRRSNLSPGKVG
jgi:hypothetical protein